jgi:pyruvate kinase
MRTKLVATLGPASSDPEMIRAMILAGVDVFRINMSHGDAEWQRRTIRKIRALSRELSSFTTILADLQGPKIRMGILESDILLNPGQELILSPLHTPVPPALPVDYPEFACDVNPGEKVLIDDGKIILEVSHTDKANYVRLRVIQGGILRSRKGINLPGTIVSQPTISAKDEADIKLALEEEVDWLALSFVRRAEDMKQLRERCLRHKPRLMAKIEKPEALDDIDAIIAEADGLMVARGDLGIEVPIERVPMIQKMIVKKCIEGAKPVIIATQMLESMTVSLTPTRAEVNDVANAVLDGADAIMLSGETSVGAYPLETVMMADKIIRQTEEGADIYYRLGEARHKPGDRYISDNVLRSACELAMQVDAKGIAALTQTGYSAMQISSFRPRARIFIFSESDIQLRQLNLLWGVEGVNYSRYSSTDETIKDLRNTLRLRKSLQTGDLLVTLVSMPISEHGMINTLKLMQI